MFLMKVVADSFREENGEAVATSQGLLRFLFGYTDNGNRRRGLRLIMKKYTTYILSFLMFMRKTKSIAIHIKRRLTSIIDNSDFFVKILSKRFLF